MADNNLNTNIEKLFRNYSEEPPSNCWEAVSQKLDVVMPVQSSVSNVPSSSNAFSKFISTTIGKTVAVFTGVAIAGVALISVFVSQNEQTPALIQNQPTTVNQTIVDPSTTKTPIITENSNTHQVDPRNSNSINVIEPSNSASNNVDNKTQINQPLSNISQPIIAQTHTPTTPNKTVSKLEVHSSIPTKTTAIESIVTPTVSADDEETTSDFIATSENISTENQGVKTSESNLRQLGVEFPNVFTPNGDGFNDFFVIKNIEKISQNRLIVINANGLKVYEANNYQNNWDADNVPNGSYFYVLESKIDGASQTFYGTIQIIR
ncbi:MAG: gliding motility-associated C-terminal domain-containing protein [Bacteroidota bacterium]